MRLCRSVISNTIIDEVKGVRVIPVRKPTIPDRMSKFVFESVRFIHPDKTDPIEAPALRAGAKMPPAAPVLKEKIEPATRIKGAYQGRYLLEVNKISVIIVFPEPIISVPEIKPRSATNSPQTNTNTTCCLFFLKRPLQLIMIIRIRPVMLPPKPANTATKITPRKM